MPHNKQLTRTCLIVNCGDVCPQCGYVCKINGTKRPCPGSGYVNLGYPVGLMLTELLNRIGFEYTPDCPCENYAAEMSANGPAWCQENVQAITSWMREEADRRNLLATRETDSIIVAKARAKAARDFDANAEWLIYLAIKLVEEAREPNRYERYKLRLMRLGNRLIG